MILEQTFPASAKKVFCQIPLHKYPKKIEGGPMPKFKSAGGELLPVHGKYQFSIKIGTKALHHQFYVIPELS
jgi:hypothetical protein